MLCKLVSVILCYVSLAPFKSLRSEDQIVLRSEFEEKVMHHDYIRIPVLNMYVRIIDAPALIFTPQSDTNAF